jgi:hypothetical protein
VGSDEKRALIERYLDAYNRFDVEGMMAGEVLRLAGRSGFAFREGKIFRLTDSS